MEVKVIVAKVKRASLTENGGVFIIVPILKKLPQKLRLYGG